MNIDLIIKIFYYLKKNCKDTESRKWFLSLRLLRKKIAETFCPRTIYIHQKDKDPLLKFNEDKVPFVNKAVFKNTPHEIIHNFLHRNDQICKYKVITATYLRKLYLRYPFYTTYYYKGIMNDSVHSFLNLKELYLIVTNKLPYLKLPLLEKLAIKTYTIHGRGYDLTKCPSLKYFLLHGENVIFDLVFFPKTIEHIYLNCEQLVDLDGFERYENLKKFEYCSRHKYACFNQFDDEDSEKKRRIFFLNGKSKF